MNKRSSSPDGPMSQSPIKAIMRDSRMAAELKLVAIGKLSLIVSALEFDESTLAGARRSVVCPASP